MQNLYPSDKVYVKQSHVLGAGRGIFARRDIKKGERIETCPIIEIPAGDASAINESTLLTYLFFHGKQKEKIWLALGFGSLYNHSYEPNASYKLSLEDSTIEFVATRDIVADSEITFDYKAGNPKEANPLWFEVK